MMHGPPDENEIRISFATHIVFSTKNQQPIIAEHVRQAMWDVMGDAARERRIRVECIGGTLDHVHLLLSPPATISVAEVVRLMKENSTAWVRETYPAMRDFAWQEGDASFGVSEEHIPALTAYLKDQARIHRYSTFQQEYIALLEENQITYDPDDLWT